jgi:uncharacterized caspase-like protein
MKAIDRIIDILPIPALIAVAIIVLGGWLTKEYQALPDYGSTLRSPTFQALAITCVCGLLLFYALHYILEKEAPFGPNEKGILISQFPHDEKALVQEQTLQSLTSRRDLDRSLTSVKFRKLSREIAESDAQKTIRETNALGLIGGTVIPSSSSTVVWYQWAWKGNEQIARLQARDFPNIDDFSSQYLQQLTKITTPTSLDVPTVENATIDALTRENERLTAAIAKLRAEAGTSEPLTQNVNRYALVIGNSAYLQIPSLRYAAADAEAFNEAIKRGLAPTNVKLLINVNYAAVMRAIDDVTHEAKAGSEIYFYYSGHSLSREGRSFILPTDISKEAPAESAIAISEVIRRLSKASPSALIFFFDCDVDPGSLDGAPGSVAFISAGRTGQPAIENAGLGHGVFTYYLLRGLAGDADLAKVGFVVAEDLFAYLQVKMPEASQGLAVPFAVLKGDRRIVVTSDTTQAK